MKDYLIRFSLFLGLILALTGCGDVPDLSEQQSDLIAEYSGGILLRYSNRYDLRLVSADVDGDGVEDGLGASAVPESPDDELQTEAPDVTETPEATQSPVVETVAPDDETLAATETPTVSLNDIYGISGLDFSFAGAEFTDKYPKKSDDVIISAGDDETLYVMTFNVKNTSNSDIDVDLTSRQSIKYELSAGGAKVSPTISVLDNGGLNYLMTTIKAKKTEKAVLIFKVDKSASASKDLSLSISEDSKTAIIDL